LYGLDLAGVREPSKAQWAVDTFHASFDLQIDERSIAFAHELTEGALEHLDELDDVIQSASRNWRIERMARVDRNILRLSTYELCHCPSVPVKVAINEAVEMAKRFGAQEAAAFVNGILDRVASAVRNG
jgi:N utilization substance protein B